MNSFLRIFVSISALLIFAGAAGAQAAGPVKIGIINSEAFADEKAGITKLIAAIKGLETRFTPARNELTGMQTRLANLKREIDAAPRTNPTQVSAVQKKIDEAETLDRDIKRKAEDAQQLYNTQSRAALQPVQTAMGAALQEFVKARGYTLLFDVAKDQNGFLLAVGDQSVDVTKDFITFFNARP